MLAEDKVEYGIFLAPPTEQQESLMIVRGPDILWLDKNKHVNENYFFDVNDVPWRDAKILWNLKYQ